MKLFAPAAPLRRFVFLGLGILVGATACEGPGGLVDPPDTRIAQVAVTGPASLQVGATAQLEATAKNAAGETLRNKDFTWRSSNDAVATVNTQGVVTALSKGSATITATSEQTPGVMSITVTVRPTIGLSQEMVSLGALVGEVAIDSVRVTNSGDGALSGLTGSVVYGAGQPTGWLTATLRSPNAPAYLVLRASAANLQPGTYDAVVTLRSSEAGTAEKTLNVKFTVAAQPVPIIELTPSSVAFNAVAGQPNPAARTVAITNVGPGTLSGLSGVVVYPLGQPSGWLRAELNTTTAPATLTLSVNAANLQPGTYAATVTLRSSEPGVADKSLPVALTVTQAPVDRLAITPNTAQIQVGQTTALNAVALSASGDTLRGRAVTWTSLNPAIATVDPSTGDVTVVKGIEPGVATIRATVEGKTAEATVTVVPVPTAPSIVVSQSSVALSAQKGQSTTATLSVTNGGDLALTGLSVSEDAPWLTATLSSPSAPATLTLTANTANLDPGTYTTTVTIASSLAGVASRQVSVTLTVTEAGVATVQVNPSTASIQVGGTVDLDAVTLSASGDTLTGRPVTWTSLNIGVATVNASTGLVTGIEPGTATIRATSEGKSADATITVTAVPVASIRIEPSSATVQVGKTVDLDAVTLSSTGAVLTGRTVMWTSLNTNVATVDASTGIVTGVAEGTATIRATSEGITADAAVTVTAPPAQPSITSISLDPDAVNVKNNERTVTAAVRVTGTVKQVTVQLAGPSGSDYTACTTDTSRGAGEFACALLIKQGAPAGTYTITRVLLAYGTADERVYTTTQLQPLGETTILVNN